ncbi:MAG TPA: DUF3467 domain-containing protein [Pyrinomonadaceae bacterium]|nr:DUF3467 domain-containing protein [Pyrinomonadaceae bacterium]
MVNPIEKTEEITIYDSPQQFVGYANINGITFTPEEVVMHLGLRRLENLNEADGVAKIYLNLPHAKRIMLALAHLIERHEMFFGEINADPGSRLTDAGRKHLEEKRKLQAETESKKENVPNN